MGGLGAGYFSLFLVFLFGDFRWLFCEGRL